MITTRIPARPTPPAKPAAVLPFTMRDIVVFLSTTFQITPIESGPDYAKFIYTEDWAGSGEEIMRIAVAARDEQLRVAFTLREFNAMHYVAEFIESPLFTIAESEQLYALIYAPGREHGWKQIGRFHAHAGLVNMSEGTEASFEFAANPPRG